MKAKAWETQAAAATAKDRTRIVACFYVGFTSLVCWSGVGGWVGGVFVLISKRMGRRIAFAL